jgi:hypothetical protein
MKSGSGQRPPRGRYNGNRPIQPQQQRTPQRNQTLDSNGPSVKIRGSANQIFERYTALAREAAIGGAIAVENLYQHAEHYFRVAGANRDEWRGRSVGDSDFFLTTILRKIERRPWY